MVMDHVSSGYRLVYDNCAELPKPLLKNIKDQDYQNHD